MAFPDPSGNIFVDVLAARQWTWNPQKIFYVWHGTGSGGLWDELDGRLSKRAMDSWSGIADMYIVPYSDPNFSNLWHHKARFSDEAFHPFNDPNHPDYDPEVRGIHTVGTTAPQYGHYNVDHPTWAEGRYFDGPVQQTMAHELGHGIGLRHPWEHPDLAWDSELINTVNTIMAYDVGGTFSHVVAPMAFDIAAIQYLYGANANYRTGNDNYIFDDSESRPWLCIWDAGGIDRITYAGKGDATIDLRPATLNPNDEFEGVLVAGGYQSIGLGFGGITIAADFMNVLPDVGGTTGVIIEDATGGIGDDTIHGNGAINTLRGGRGADKILGGNGGDFIYGEADNDTELFGEDGDDTIFGGAGFDKLFGGNHNDTLHGEAEDDELYGDAGNDTLKGGRGIDRLYGGDHADTLDGEEDKDFLWGGNGNDKLFGDTSVTKGGDDELYGEGGNDELHGRAGNDILNGGTGADIMRGGWGNDTYWVDDPGDDPSERYSASVGKRARDGGGIDEIITTLNDYSLEAINSDISIIEKLTFAGAGSFTGRGDARSNDLRGYLARDFLYGNAGNDRLSGGSIGVSDFLDGGAGDDTYLIEDLVDEVMESAGAGVDTADVASHVIGYVLDANVENMRVAALQTPTGNTAFGNELANNITAQMNRAFFDAPIVFNLHGMGGADTITGADWSNSTDLLDGGAGDDILKGMAGNDTLRGGLGADTMDGGTGIDTADFSLAAESVTVNIKSGGIAGEAAGDKLKNVENLTGSSLGDDLTGDAKANVLTGGDGDDYLDGGAGIDTLLGGDGNDRITADSTDIVDGGAGIEDYVYASKSTRNGGFTFNVLGTNVEIVSGNAGRDRIDATGIAYSVTILGLGGDDVLTGGNGNDAFFGGEGRDTINGGEGFDQISGEGGDDILVGGGATSSPFGDRLFGGLGNDTLTGSGNGWLFGEEGNDIIHAVLGDWANGGDGNDTIVGSAGFQQIEGGAGNDIMTGGLEAGLAGLTGDFFDFKADWGADTITDFELGVDRLRFILGTNANGASDLNVTTVAGVGTLIELLGQTVMLSGVFADKATIEANGEISIVGTEGDDELFGTGSNDLIQGLGGNDKLYGLAGNDKLHGGTGNDRLEGGTGRNELYGDDGDDTLVGGDTFDVLDGGDGNDTLVGSGGQTGMFGGDGDDTLIGSLNSGNVMYGGLGDDTFTGGNGTDSIYDTDGGDDTVHAGDGDDVILDHYGVNELYGEGGNDIITSASDQGSLLDGGEGNDTLYAVYGGNTLLGGNGDDLLEVADGGAIANIFTGGAGADTFIYRQGVGADSNVIVTDFEDGTDMIGLRVFTDLGLVTVTDTAQGALIGYVGANSPMLLSGVSAGLIDQNDFVIV